VRQKLQRLSDKALDTFEDIMDNSEDDKARNIAASKITDIWASLNDVKGSIGIDAGSGGVNNIQINLNNLKGALFEAGRALRNRQTADEGIEIQEMHQEVLDFERRTLR